MSEAGDALRRDLYQGACVLEAEEILRLLPHRPPILLLDRVVALVPGHHAVGVKLVTGNEFGLSTRAHGFVFPATLALEALVQLATVVIRYPDSGLLPVESAAEGIFLFEAEKVAVHREMVCGDRLHLHVDISPSRQWPRVAAGQATLGGAPYVDARFKLAQEL